MVKRNASNGAAPAHVTSLRTATRSFFFFLKSIHAKVSPGATLTGVMLAAGNCSMKAG